MHRCSLPCRTWPSIARQCRPCIGCSWSRRATLYARRACAADSGDRSVWCCRQLRPSGRRPQRSSLWASTSSVWLPIAGLCLRTVAPRLWRFRTLWSWTRPCRRSSFGATSSLRASCGRFWWSSTWAEAILHSNCSGGLLDCPTRDGFRVHLPSGCLWVRITEHRPFGFHAECAAECGRRRRRCRYRRWPLWLVAARRWQRAAGAASCRESAWLGWEGTGRWWRPVRREAC